MSKPEWGTKRVCLNCNTRFYDLQRQPITCPKCASVFDPDVFTKKKRGRPPVAETKPIPLPQEGEETIDLEEDIAAFDENDEVLEDTSDFGDDEKVVGIESTSDDD